VKHIIVGTLPPPRFCTNELKPKDVEFPYGSAENLLWPCLQEAFNENFLFETTGQAIENRKQFLIKHHIGVCDIVASCQREKIDASDLGMKNIKLRDILGYLKQYPSIQSIIFTGGNSKNGPEYFLRQVLKEAHINYTLVNKDIPKIHHFIFETRDIKTISLTSPSNAANRFIGSCAHYKEQKAINSEYTTMDFRTQQYEHVFKTLIHKEIKQIMKEKAQ
jgi:G:T/U-mismatch repair DNA glycosylase